MPSCGRSLTARRIAEPLECTDGAHLLLSLLLMTHCRSGVSPSLEVCSWRSWTSAGRVRAGHREHVQRFVELGLGQVARLDVATGDDDVADGATFAHGRPDDCGGCLVAQVAAERCHDRR